MLGTRTGRWLWEVDGFGTEVEKKRMLLVSNGVEGEETSRSQEPGVFLAERKSQSEKCPGGHGGKWWS